MIQQQSMAARVIFCRLLLLLLEPAKHQTHKKSHNAQCSQTHSHINTDTQEKIQQTNVKVLL